MSPNPMGTADVTDNDRLMAALAYPLSPLVSIIILLVESMKNRPFQRYHAMQSLQLYYAYRAYQGAYFEVPVVTGFMRGQGWMK